MGKHVSSSWSNKEIQELLLDLVQVQESVGPSVVADPLYTSPKPQSNQRLAVVWRLLALKVNRYGLFGV